MCIGMQVRNSLLRARYVQYVPGNRKRGLTTCALIATRRLQLRMQSGCSFVLSSFTCPWESVRKKVALHVHNGQTRGGWQGLARMGKDMTG